MPDMKKRLKSMIRSRKAVLAGPREWLQFRNQIMINPVSEMSLGFFPTLERLAGSDLLWRLLFRGGRRNVSGHPSHLIVVIGGCGEPIDAL